MQICFITCRYLIYLAGTGNRKKSRSFRINNKYIRKYWIVNSKFIITKPGPHNRINNTKFLNAHAPHRSVFLHKSPINMLESAKSIFINTVPINNSILLI
jgi:hypothetical protein